MNTVNLKRKDGTTIAELPLYPDLYHIPLNRYIDFLKAREPLDYKDPEVIPERGINVPAVLAKAVGEFFGVPIDEILRAEFGDYEENENAPVTGNVQSLYAWIVTLLGTFKGRIRKLEDCFFEYKGERYEIPIIGLQTLAGLPMLPDLETGQMIEAYEIRRVSQMAIEKEKDTDGSHTYSYYLRLIAVLCRKKGEKFPIFESDIETFTNERMVHLQEIDAGTALDIDFFLAGLMKSSATTHASIGSLVNPCFDLVQAIQRPRKLKGKHSRRRLRVQKKYSNRSDGGKPILSYLKGAGLTNLTKARLKQ